MSTSRKARSIRNSRRRRVPATCLSLVALLVGLCRSATLRAEDSVYLAVPNNPQARAKVTGRVQDYNGRELVLDVGGNDKRYPAEQIVDVDSDWTPTELAADELFARREYTEALRSTKRRSAASRAAGCSASWLRR